MQVHTFPNGGFVVHRIPALAPSPARVSMWFGPLGNALDAELIYPNGRTRTVVRYGPIWQHAQSWGRTYAARQGACS
jgi:hypothetical protein